MATHQTPLDVLLGRNPCAISNNDYRAVVSKMEASFKALIEADVASRETGGKFQEDIAKAKEASANMLAGAYARLSISRALGGKYPGFSEVDAASITIVGEHDSSVNVGAVNLVRAFEREFSDYAERNFNSRRLT